MAFRIENRTLVKYEGNEESVILPDEVEIIGDYAFYGAKNLKHISMHDHVQEIGTNAFYNCENLEEVILPDSISFMDSAVFSRCSSLRKAKLPSGLTALPKITFYQCEKLEEVIFPGNMFRMNRSCFEQCHSLRNVELPLTLRIIEDNVFDDCISLQEITLPDGIKILGSNVFFNCSSMKRINLPESLQSIGKGALETRGKICITGNETLFVKPEMLDNNWNMYWNFGANHRWNGKNEENYQLENSYLPNVELRLWKPAAQCVLAVNYLETWKQDISGYNQWIAENTDTLLEKIVSEKRYSALNTALDQRLIASASVEPYLKRIDDREEKAKLLDRNSTQSIDDLFDLL